ncbi:putative DNA base-flipping protein [Pseudoalteromonas phage PHS3]|nr:putative DNA base-flipping protein [Pseudoalteromonas phage PHS3]
MIDKFKLITTNRDSLIQQLDVMLSLNEAVEVVARPWKVKRSLSQNSLYWCWLNEISDQVTVSDKKHNAEIWHEYFKRYFCPVKIIAMPAGDDLEVRTTKKLDTGEMHFYLNRIEQWAMDKMIKLTIPAACEYQQLRDKQNK